MVEAAGVGLRLRLAPLAVPLDRLNQLLADLGQAPLAEQDYKRVDPTPGWATKP